MRLIFPYFSIVLKNVILILVCLLCSRFCVAQTSAFAHRITYTDSVNYTTPREKIFVHTDKPYYKLADTLWLKGYTLTAAENIASDSSKIAYVEIIDITGNVVKRINPPCNWGMFESYIALTAADFSQGQYLLRAYTQHMRNFGDSLFFTAPFTIVDPANDVWKISLRQLSLRNNRLQLNAKLSASESETVRKKPVTIRLRSKNKNLFRAALIPDYDGAIVADTLLSNVSDQNLAIEISGEDNLRLTFPVTIAQDSVDLQFLPEGGSFIAGKEQRLGFKAINSKGLGVPAGGVIKNSKGTVVAGFAALRYGMGAVRFTPQPGEIYTAVTDDGRSYSLPVVQNSGVSLAVQNNPGADSILITVQGSADKTGSSVYLAVTCRGMVLARGKINIKNEPYELKLNRKDLPSGVIVCRLMNEDLLPINERAFFVWQNDALQLSLTPNKPIFAKKDSVSVAIKVMDKDNQPVAGSFSMSVVDTSQVAMSSNRENLLSYMVLGSDVRGRIEDPYYYFSHPLSEETDVLMLTQAWVSYWRNELPLQYAYQKHFSISGKVMNVFNKPLVNSSITLFGKAGKNSAFLLDTTTTDKGTFTFSNFPLYETDSISMVFRALNRRGKAFNVGIELDEPDYPTYNNKLFATTTIDVVKDTAIKKYMVAQENIVEQMKKDGTYLKEVIIKGRSAIPGSRNLNKDGGANQVINEATLEKTPKKSLLDVLQEQVKGFRVGMLPKGTIQRYMINSNMVRFIIDGVDLEFFFDYNSVSSSMDYLNYYKSNLSYFSAEDVKGIEVMNTPTYNSAYRSHFLSIQELLSTGPARVDFSFVEITTHSGSGPFMRKTPGMYLYKPVFPFISKQFYSPKYASPDEVTAFPDFRTTIYWNPNIITNENGEATVTFYTSEKKTNYFMLLQGTNLQGDIGVRCASLSVE